jgi:hypothetical protein
MSSAGKIDTAATMHAAMAAVASLSLGMACPPGSHLDATANQGLGLNNSSLSKIHHLVNRGCDLGGSHPRHVDASRDRAGQGHVFETLEHRDDPHASKHGHVPPLLAIGRYQVGWREERDKEVRIGDGLFYETDNVPVLESRKNRRNRSAALARGTCTTAPVVAKRHAMTAIAHVHPLKRRIEYTLVVIIQGCYKDFSIKNLGWHWCMSSCSCECLDSCCIAWRKKEPGGRLYLGGFFSYPFLDDTII